MSFMHTLDESLISRVPISFGQLIIFRQCSLIALNVLYAYP